MADNKYGRLFTESDMQQIVNVACLDGSPVSVAEIVADWERNRGLQPFTFPPDEPLFLLRGKDLSAPGAILYYSQTCEERGATESYVEAAVDTGLAMIDWQEANPDRTKVPDTEPATVES